MLLGRASPARRVVVTGHQVPGDIREGAHAFDRLA
jgi:hypothetical protein